MSAFDTEKYLDTFQWHIYLELFQADIFQWNVFKWREDTKKPKHYIVTDFDQLRAYRYPDMRKDIQYEIAFYFLILHTITFPISTCRRPLK